MQRGATLPGGSASAALVREALSGELSGAAGAGAGAAGSRLSGGGGGAQSLSLRVLAGPDKGRVLPLPTPCEPGAQVGRDPGAALCLRDPLASREHGRLSVDARGQAAWTDSSRNGTLLVRAGARAGTTIRADTVPLAPGDSLLFGSTALALIRAPAAEAAAAAAAAAAAFGSSDRDAEAAAERAELLLEEPWAAALSPPSTLAATPSARPTLGAGGAGFGSGGSGGGWSPRPGRVRSGSAAAAEAAEAQWWPSAAPAPAPAAAGAAAAEAAEAVRLAQALAAEDAAVAARWRGAGASPTARAAAANAGAVAGVDGGSGGGGMGVRRVSSGLLRISVGEVVELEALPSSEARAILHHPFTQMAIARGRAARAAWTAARVSGEAATSPPHSHEVPALSPALARMSRSRSMFSGSRSLMPAQGGGSS